MFVNESLIRVRYAETDQMSYVYYGNYAQYCEVGRVEALRSLGLSYKEMEDSGIMLPVVHYAIDYFKPALYDDLIKVVTTIPEIPTAKIKFLYEMYNEQGVLLTKSETILVFVNKNTGRPCKAPPAFLEKIATYF